jgi:hypothetical protein
LGLALTLAIAVIKNTLTAVRKYRIEASSKSLNLALTLLEKKRKQRRQSKLLCLQRFFN